MDWPIVGQGMDRMAGGGLARWSGRGSVISPGTYHIASEMMKQVVTRPKLKEEEVKQGILITVDNRMYRR